jgi:predicted nucleic acid-binding protein
MRALKVMLNALSSETERFDEEVDRGERAAILLAESLHADLILIDERAASRIARARGNEKRSGLWVF